MSGTVGERKCAALLAGLQADDRAFLLSRLPAQVRQTLTQLIREAKAQGFSSVDAEDLLLKESLSPKSADTRVPEQNRFNPELLPSGIPEAWRARIAEAAASEQGGQRTNGRPSQGFPSKLQQALLEEARALVARESVPA